LKKDNLDTQDFIISLNKNGKQSKPRSSESNNWFSSSN